jgi:hypothetical protein
MRDAVTAAHHRMRRVRWTDVGRRHCRLERRRSSSRTRHPELAEAQLGAASGSPARDTNHHRFAAPDLRPTQLQQALVRSSPRPLTTDPRLRQVVPSIAASGALSLPKAAIDAAALTSGDSVGRKAVFSSLAANSSPEPARGLR